MTEGRVETQWCTRCGARFTADEVKEACACPKCGDTGVPCDCGEDVTVEVNWHELRVLGIWAENWARHCKDQGGEGNNGANMPSVVAAITRRLRAQHPGFAPLTLSAEIAALPANLAKAGIDCGPIETNIDRPPLLAVNGPGAVGHNKKTA